MHSTLLRPVHGGFAKVSVVMPRRGDYIRFNKDYHGPRRPNRVTDMKHDIDQPIDIIAVEREARRLRAEAFADAVRRLRARLFTRPATGAARTA
jgi:hypothetical protein